MPYSSSLSKQFRKRVFLGSYCSITAHGIFLSTEREERDQKALVCKVSCGEAALFKNLGVC